MSGEPLLRIEALAGGYGPTRILHGVDLAVPGGAVTALLGANGAGKTTLMKTLAGVLPASGGRVFFRGEEITRLSAAERVLAGIVLVPEGRLVFPDLSVHENLRLGAVNKRARAGWREALDEVHAIFPKLLERRHQAAATLSGGEQQMLAIGRGLMARPSLMLLDEPTLGLAPLVALHMFELIRNLSASITLLVAEQDVQRTLDVAHRGYVIENGRVALEGDAADLAQDPKIRQAYLGL
jgi:branched-chain amino acid transport system ATP-binding protein